MLLIVSVGDVIELSFGFAGVDGLVCNACSVVLLVVVVMVC